MKPLSDRTLEHLRRVVDEPDLRGTRYRLVSELARGGMGTVYVAHDRQLDRRVALKVLNPTLEGSAIARRMVREARVVAKLEHPGIVPVHDVGTLPDGRVFYCMKLVRGEQLDRHVGPSTTLREKLRLFERICEPVAFAHSHGVVHRDLKPSNVMVGPFGEVLILDWGLAKTEEGVATEPADSEDPDVPSVHEAQTPPIPEGGPPGATRPGTVLGTPGYMSPEQASGRSELVDGRSDVFALGILLEELVQSSDEPVPRRLRAVISKATATGRAERYQSVAALGSDVSRFLDGAPVSAYRERMADIAARWLERYRAPILLIVTYLVVRALILALAGT